MSPNKPDMHVDVSITLEKLVQQLSKAEARSIAATYKMEKRWQESSRRSEKAFKEFTDKSSARVERLGAVGQRVAAIMASAFSAREVIQYADAWTTASNKLAASSEVAGRQARSLSEVNEIATRTRSGLTETADLYSKLLRATKDVAKSELDVARATETVNKAFKAGGAAASEYQAGVLQLAQGLSSGYLQGDELRSLRENAPLVAQAIADEFNTTIGGLKQLGADGELTAARVFKAILNAEQEVEAAFARTNSTIGESFTILRNALTEYVSGSDQSLGATQRISAAMSGLANNLDALTAAGIALGARFIGPVLLTQLVRATTQIRAASVAMHGLSAGAKASAASLSVMRGVLGLLGGPIGAAITAFTVLPLLMKDTDDKVRALSTSNGTAKTALEEYASAAKQAADEQENLGGKISDTTEKMLAQSRLQLQNTLKDLKVEYQDVYNDILGVGIFDKSELGPIKNKVDLQLDLDEQRGGLGPNAFIIQIDQALKNLEAGKLSLSEVSAELEKLAGVNDDLALLAGTINAASIDGDIAKIEDLSGELLQATEGVTILQAEIDALKSADGIDAVSDATVNLAGKIIDLRIAGQLLDNFVDLRVLLQEAGATEVQIKEIEEALGMTVNELEAATNAANDLSTAADDIDFDAAKKSAEALAKQIGVALDAASKLADQGRYSAGTAELRLQYRDDPVALAGALAKAKFDEEVDLNSLPDGARAQAEKDREASIAAARREAMAQQELDRLNELGSAASKYADSISNYDAGTSQISELTLQLELIGKTTSEVAYLTTQHNLLAAAKEKGLNLDQRSRETNRTLSEEIEAQARKVGELTKRVEEKSKAQGFFNEMQDVGRQGMIDAIVEAENLSDVLGDLSKMFAKAALEAALFGSGPMASTFGLSGSGLLGGMLPSFDGGGFTWNGPRVGGIDGKGGRFAILHPEETVVDHLSPPTIMKRKSGSSTISLSIPISIDATGADAAGLQRVEQSLAQMSAELPSRIKSEIDRADYEGRL